MEHKQGNCPKCNSESLNYDAVVLAGNQQYFPYTCDECSFAGQEWYTMTFSGHFKDDGTGEEA